MKRWYVWSSKAWYANKNEKPEVMFGCDDSGGEMGMRWYETYNFILSPRLESYDDSWKALHSFSDLIETLAKHDDQNITPEKFIEILKAHKFEDATVYEIPEGVKNNVS